MGGELGGREWMERWLVSWDARRGKDAMKE